MSTLVSTSELKLTRTDAGVLRIGETRVSLDSVIIAFLEGSAPEEIVFDYDSLTLSEVYAVISYYLQNREVVDAYLAGRTAQNSKLREELLRRFDQRGIREKLMSRRRNAA